MRRIDADALMRQLEKKRSETGAQRYTEGFNDALMRFRSMIHSAPTIDAEPVRHGTWVEERGDLHSSGRVVTCPLCHKQHFIPSRTMSWWVSDESVFQKPDRCRNCGAKMDGGGSDE